MLSKEKNAPAIVGILIIDKTRHIVRPILLALYKLTATPIQNKPKSIKATPNDRDFSTAHTHDPQPQTNVPKAASAIPAIRTGLGGFSGCIITTYVIYLRIMYKTNVSTVNQTIDIQTSANDI